MCSAQIIEVNARDDNLNESTNVSKIVKISNDMIYPPWRTNLFTVGTRDE